MQPRRQSSERNEKTQKRKEDTGASAAVKGDHVHGSPDGGRASTQPERR